MKCEIYQEIDKIIQEFSLTKEEIDQMYLDEGITDKSLEQQLADIEKELDDLATRYGMSAESRLLSLFMDSDRRKFIVINEMNVYEQKLEDIEYQLEDSYCDDDTFLALFAKYQEYENYLHELQQEYLTYQEQEEVERFDKERYKVLKKKLLDKRDQLQEKLDHPEEKILSAGIGKRRKSRDYPSDELRNKVFHGTIKLARFYARRYQEKAKGKFTYDDLFQMASEALLSACHYYVPNGNANFFTYASCCIRNRLNRELFPKKRKRTKNFFEHEKHNISYIDIFLNLQFREIGKINPFDRYTPVGFIRKFKKLIAQYNSDMLNTNQPSKVFSVENRKRDESEQYELLIDKVSKMLSTGKLQLLISDDDRRMVSELSAYHNVFSEDLEPWTLLEYLKIYTSRLEDIETYLSIFEEIQEDGVDGKLFYDELLKRFNQRVHEFNSNVYRLRHTKEISLQPRTTYFWEYYDQYDVNFLYNECFDWGVSRDEEKEQIREEKEEEFDYDDFGLTEEYEEMLEEMVKEELASRRDHVLEIVKEKNEPIFAANRKSLEDKKYLGKSYRKRYRMQDILEIEKNISLLYSDDESIFDSPEVRRKNVHLSVEEQAEVKLFLEDYHGVLETLSPIQKNILNLWFDEDGIHSMSAKEISFALGVSPKKVYREKEKAIKILQKSKVLQGYREM